VQVGRRHLPARQAFQNGPTSGTDVFVPLDWLIGGRECFADAAAQHLRLHGGKRERPARSAQHA
jgi:alkylation response protein AidB-like acyl-CoA dehydrogenase